MIATSQGLRQFVQSLTTSTIIQFGEVFAIKQKNSGSQVHGTTKPKAETRTVHYRLFTTYRTINKMQLTAGQAPQRRGQASSGTLPSLLFLPLFALFTPFLHLSFPHPFPRLSNPRSLW